MGRGSCCRCVMPGISTAAATSAQTRAMLVVSYATLARNRHDTRELLPAVQQHQLDVKTSFRNSTWSVLLAAPLSRCTAIGPVAGIA